MKNPDKNLFDTGSAWKKIGAIENQPDSSYLHQFCFEKKIANP